MRKRELLKEKVRDRERERDMKDREKEKTKRETGVTEGNFVYRAKRPCKEINNQFCWPWITNLIVI